jgi:hypothetical protein
VVGVTVRAVILRGGRFARAPDARPALASGGSSGDTSMLSSFSFNRAASRSTAGSPRRISFRCAIKNSP